MEITGKLSLDATHTMHWVQSGNSQGQPVLLLHGGPGAGMDASQRQVFDQRHYRLIEFDQRGCGQSTPHGELSANTTAHLVQDIEQLRQHLEIDRWFVLGGSWGSYLALSYALRFHDHVSGMILRGVFLGSQSEVAWYLQGMRRVFPEAWRRFSHFLPESRRSHLLKSYKALVLDPDPAVHYPAARSWCEYEASCSTLLPEPITAQSWDDQQALVLARIQTHYFDAAFFPGPRPLLDTIDRLRTLPCIILQGRYDMICPVSTADQLHRRWPEAQYRVIPNAGHAASEPGMRRALSAASLHFRQLNAEIPDGVKNERIPEAYTEE